MTHIYHTLWNKYRHAIVQLMLASADGPQQYKFYHHEFKGLNPKERDYSFNLHAFQGRATNNIKTSNTAQDLLATLKLSRKAVELMDENEFEFVLDKKFVLHINRTGLLKEAIEPAEMAAG